MEAPVLVGAMGVGRLLALSAQRVDDVVLVEAPEEGVAGFPAAFPLVAVGCPGSCAHFFLALVVLGGPEAEQAHC